MKLSTAGDKTVATEDGSIEDQIATFVEATSTVLRETQASEETVDTVETVGEELIETIETVDSGVTTMSEVTRAEFEQLKQIVEAQGERIAELEREKRERVNESEDDTSPVDDDGTDQREGEDDQDANGEDDLQERVSKLEQESQFHLEDIADLEVATRDLEDRLDDVENRLSADGAQSPNGEDTDAGPTVEPQTHLEDVARLPSRLTEDHAPNSRRALFVARDVVEYSQAVDEGRIIKWSSLRRVLQAGCDNGYDQTVKRVIEILDDMGEEETKVVDKKRYEKRIWFSDEIVARLDELCSNEDETHGVVSEATG